MSIGRIAGIDIRVHATFVLLIALFALAGTAPESPGVVGSLLWLVAIFACVLVHELAHCFVGRSRGAVVHEIVLLPIGGVSKLEHLPGNPRDELAMAIAGPLASLGLAVGAAIGAVAMGVALLPVDLVNGAIVARIFWFNLIVAGFNLLPAFPLDGGRVFRAALERRRDLLGATRIAVRVGHAVAIALVVLGVLFNVWLVLIGIFVYLGATAEEAATLVHVRLEGRRVADVMLLEPVVVPPSTTRAQLLALVRRSPQRVFPVVLAGHYRGLVDATAIERGDPGATALALADATVPTVGVDDEVEDDVALLLTAPPHAVAVTDATNLVTGLLRLEEVQHLVASDEGPVHRAT
jgi:stage IV sporulation protein FB